MHLPRTSFSLTHFHVSQQVLTHFSRARGIPTPAPVVPWTGLPSSMSGTSNDRRVSNYQRAGALLRQQRPFGRGSSKKSRHQFGDVELLTPVEVPTTFLVYLFPSPVRVPQMQTRFHETRLTI